MELITPLTLPCHLSITRVHLLFFKPAKHFQSEKNKCVLSNESSAITDWNAFLSFASPPSFYAPTNASSCGCRYRVPQSHLVDQWQKVREWSSEQCWSLSKVKLDGFSGEENTYLNFSKGRQTKNENESSLFSLFFVT